jgi:hypothetical protein
MYVIIRFFPFWVFVIFDLMGSNLAIGWLPVPAGMYARLEILYIYDIKRKKKRVKNFSHVALITRGYNFPFFLENKITFSHLRWHMAKIATYIKGYISKCTFSNNRIHYV